MHIAPGTEGIQPTNINWTLVLMTFIIFIAIGTLIYLMVTIVEAMKDINKTLDQALATRQLQAQQVQQTQQTQGPIQNMPTQPTAQPSVMNTQAAVNTTMPTQHAIEEINNNHMTQMAQTAQETNQYLSPSDKALNEAWKAGYESAKAQYESLQHMPANGNISATNKTTNTTDDATDAETVETTDIIIEDATSTDNTSSTTDK